MKLSCGSVGSLNSLQLCVTNIVSCPGCPTDLHLFLPVLFLSSQTFSFLTTLSTFNHHRNVIFHICGVYVVFFGGGISLSLRHSLFHVTPPRPATTPLSFTLLLILLSLLLHHYLPALPKLPNMHLCKRKEKQNGPSVNSWDLGVALLARTD